MTDSYQELRDRFSGITRSSEVVSRIQLDLANRAAAELEAEQRAEQQQRQEALAREAALIAAADAAAVEKLAALKALYQARQEAARQAIEAIASLWRIEQEIRDGLQLADREVAAAEYLIEPSARSGRRQALRERAGLAARHIFTAPKQWVATDAQRTGAVAVAGITSGIIGAGWIQSAHDRIDFEF